MQLCMSISVFYGTHCIIVFNEPIQKDFYKYEGIMKNVLIITDLSHASPRIPGLCKYFAEEGWKATILTAPLGKTHKERLVIPTKDARIIEVAYPSMLDFWKKIVGFKDGQGVLAQLEQKFPAGKMTFIESFLSKLFILGGTFFAYPDEMRAWRNPAVKEAKKLIASEKFDAILSSSFPITSHLIARQLTRETSIPWLADLRDLWTQNHNYLFPKRKFIETRLEKNTLSKAHAFSTVSDSLSQKLKSRYQKASISIITNGFDPDLINEPPIPLTQKFTITYTGLIYKNKQDPAKLFEALRDLLAEGLIERSDVQIRFYGTIQKWIAQLASLFGMQDIITQYGPVFRDEAILRQRESQVLLLFGWEEEYETGVLPLKMFEYFAARRPILATGGTLHEQFRSLINNTQAGEFAIEVSGIKEILYRYYCDYKEKQAVIYHGISLEMDKYNYREMAKKFSLALNTISKKERIS